MSNTDDLLALLDAPAPAHVPGQLALIADDRPGQLALDLDAAPVADPTPAERAEARWQAAERRRHELAASSASTVAAAAARAWLAAHPA